MPGEPEQQRAEWTWRDFSKVAAAIGVVMTLYGAVMFGLVRADEVTAEQAGQIGDTFGFVNALFSGLAFAGVLFSLEMQRRELGLQREELEATRKVMQEERDALKDQHAVMREQLAATREYAKQPLLELRFDGAEGTEDHLLRGRVFNESDDHAVNVVIHCFVLLNKGDPADAVMSQADHVGLLAPDEGQGPIEVYQIPGVELAMRVQGGSPVFRRDAEPSRGEVVMRALFRNVTGGTFVTWAAFTRELRYDGVMHWRHSERDYVQAAEPIERWHREREAPTLEALVTYLSQRPAQSPKHEKPPLPHAARGA